MNNEKFWLLFWSIVGATIISLTIVGVYSGIADDRRDLSMAEKSLQKYRVERCTDVSVKTEWHEAGWTDKNSINLQKDMRK